MKDHQEIIDQYLAFQKTDEYRNSPGARLKELLTQFNQVVTLTRQLGGMTKGGKRRGALRLPF